MPVFQLSNDILFPPPELAREDGLLAVGGDLSVPRLLLAYQMGIFPWYSPGEPILWWSPDPRMVLFPDQLKVSRSLAKTLRHAGLGVTFDTAFAQVIQACALTPRAGQSGTWISAAMQQAYRQLHELGYAHSVETWHAGKLVGGLYGVALGRAFFGESMFSHRSDASKIALVHLCRFLMQHDFGIIDCQMETKHLASLGARPIPRDDFLARLAALVDAESIAARWSAP